MTRMTAAQLRALQPRKRPRDLEGPIHRAILHYLGHALPNDAMVHHSPNEVDAAGPHVARAIGKATGLGRFKGWPDLEIVWRGRVYFIEVKAPKGRLSDAQARCHADLTKAGAPVAVARSVDDVAAALADWGLAPPSDDDWQLIGDVAARILDQAVAKGRRAE